MDAEIVEIADDDGICTLRVTHGVHVPLRLLKGGHHNPLTQLRLIQVHAEGLLLDNRLGGRNGYVDEASLGGRCLEMDVRCHILHAHHITQQLKPEGVGVAFLVPASFPLLSEIPSTLDAATLCSHKILGQQGFSPISDVSAIFGHRMRRG